VILAPCPSTGGPKNKKKKRIDENNFEKRGSVVQYTERCLEGSLCSVLFARAPVLRLCFFVFVVQAPRPSTNGPENKKKMEKKGW